MNYCHECGSEIAEIDTFCPFCGILLTPKANSENPAVESSTLTNADDKTVLINNSEMETLLPPSESNASEKFDAFDSNFTIDDSVPSENQSVTDSETQKSESNENESEHSEIPSFYETEKPQTDFNDLSELDRLNEQSNEKSETVSSDDLTLYDAPRPQVLSENLESDSVFENSENISEENNENNFDSGENEISEPANFEKENLESILETGTVAEDTEDESSYKVPASDSENQAQNTIFASEEPNLEDGEKFVENQPEQIIEMPDFPIESVENRDTTFDSVKIMEDVKPPVQTEVPQVISTDDIKAEASEEIKAEPAEPVEKERSHTTPNFGAGDTDGRKSPKLKPLDEGTVLNGRYEVVRKIGGGGMGAVYLATDRNLGGILRAVKEMIQSYIEESQQDKAVSDFKRESMLLTSLDHPSIPTIYDYFYDEKEGRFYLVMKYISGGDLASRLRAAPQGRLDEETVVSWAMQIADVLDYLHNRQPPIIYRDLKPANIMIDGNSGRTMLIDFGIARWVNKEEKGVTAVGTMGYAPPELFSGNVAPSSDIYSLGSTMFHLLTGADPQSNPLLIFDFQKHPRPRQINPQLSDQIEQILLKMVEYNADKRYRTAGEVRDALSKHLESLKIGKATFGISKAPSAVSFADQLVFCGFCGQKIVATDMFCAFCGSKQPLAQQGVNSAEYHISQATAKLFVIGTNELEVPTFVIEKDDNLVGRRDPLSNIFPEVDLSKFDPQTKISRRHAHIWRDGNKFLLEDLGSSNGTLVLRVVGDAIKLNPHQPHTLVNGEKIKIGDTTLHFVQN